jgi:hypothetical protein
MSSTPIAAPPSAPSVDQLVKQLITKVDTNKDGQISTEEFGSFLTALIEGAVAVPSTRKSQATGAEPSVGGEEEPLLDEGTEIHPSGWTDNNAPYGVTFAGWSPQNHRDLTLEDLGVPGKAEKYAVYNHLLSNQVQPTSDWAPGVAEALNAKYNTTVYRAIDGETLGFGNEYVHSAPNGHGMARGTYNPNATGEFYWGWV